MTAVDYSKNCCLFCPYLGTLQCHYTQKTFGYLPSLMAPSARHRSHFFPSSFSDMLNISLRHARSVKPSSGAAFSCCRKSQYYDLNAEERSVDLLDKMQKVSGRQTGVLLNITSSARCCSYCMWEKHILYMSSFMAVYMNASLQTSRRIYPTRFHVAILR